MVGPEEWKKKRDTIHHYDRLANAYETLYRDEQILKIKLALEAIQMGSSDIVLDVGCGTGFLFDYIGNLVDLIVGVDMSPVLLKVAANRYKCQSNRSSVCLVRVDADYLPFSGKVFDKVFVFTLLQNIVDPNKALREMVRVARSGSTIVVTGLKKSFSEEGFKNILIRAGLKSTVLISREQAKDVIAVCRKV